MTSMNAVLTPSVQEIVNDDLLSGHVEFTIGNSTAFTYNNSSSNGAFWFCFG